MWCASKIAGRVHTKATVAAALPVDNRPVDNRSLASLLRDQLPGNDPYRRRDMVGTILKTDQVPTDTDAPVSAASAPHGVCLAQEQTRPADDVASAATALPLIAVLQTTEDGPACEYAPLEMNVQAKAQGSVVKLVLSATFVDVAAGSKTPQAATIKFALPSGVAQAPPPFDSHRTYKNGDLVCLKNGTIYRCHDGENAQGRDPASAGNTSWSRLEDDVSALETRPTGSFVVMGETVTIERDGVAHTKIPRVETPQVAEQKFDEASRSEGMSAAITRSAVDGHTITIDSLPAGSRIFATLTLLGRVPAVASGGGERVASLVLRAPEMAPVRIGAPPKHEEVLAMLKGLDGADDAELARALGAMNRAPPSLSGEMRLPDGDRSAVTPTEELSMKAMRDFRWGGAMPKPRIEHEGRSFTHQTCLNPEHTDDFAGGTRIANGRAYRNTEHDLDMSEGTAAAKFGDALFSEYVEVIVPSVETVDAGDGGAGAAPRNVLSFVANPSTGPTEILYRWRVPGSGDAEAPSTNAALALPDGNALLRGDVPVLAPKTAATPITCTSCYDSSCSMKVQGHGGMTVSQNQKKLALAQAPALSRKVLNDRDILVDGSVFASAAFAGTRESLQNAEILVIKVDATAGAAAADGCGASTQLEMPHVDGKIARRVVTLSGDAERDAPVLEAALKAQIERTHANVRHGGTNFMVPCRFWEGLLKTFPRHLGAFRLFTDGCTWETSKSDFLQIVRELRATYPLFSLSAVLIGPWTDEAYMQTLADSDDAVFSIPTRGGPDTCRAAARYMDEHWDVMKRRTTECVAVIRGARHIHRVASSAARAGAAPLRALPFGKKADDAWYADDSDDARHPRCWVVDHVEANSTLDLCLMTDGDATQATVEFVSREALQALLDGGMLDGGKTEARPSDDDGAFDLRSLATILNMTPSAGSPDADASFDGEDGEDEDYTMVGAGGDDGEDEAAAPALTAPLTSLSTPPQCLVDLAKANVQGIPGSCTRSSCKATGAAFREAAQKLFKSLDAALEEHAASPDATAESMGKIIIGHDQRVDPGVFADMVGYKCAAMDVLNHFKGLTTDEIGGTVLRDDTGAPLASLSLAEVEAGAPSLVQALRFLGRVINFPASLGPTPLLIGIATKETPVDMDPEWHARTTAAQREQLKLIEKNISLTAQYVDSDGSKEPPYKRRRYDFEDYSGMCTKSYRSLQPQTLPVYRSLAVPSPTSMAPLPTAAPSGTLAAITTKLEDVRKCPSLLTDEKLGFRRDQSTLCMTPLAAQRLVREIMQEVQRDAVVAKHGAAVKAFMDTSEDGGTAGGGDLTENAAAAAKTARLLRFLTDTMMLAPEQRRAVLQVLLRAFPPSSAASSVPTTAPVPPVETKGASASSAPATAWFA